MPLTADQTALLELILARGQGYEDLASLLGISEPQVRERARAALAELGGADPDRDVGLTDYLLGQADPIGRADAARHLRTHPGDLEMATALAGRLREIAPEAELPKLVSSREGAQRPARRRAGRIKVPGSRLRRRAASQDEPAAAGPAAAPPAGDAAPAGGGPSEAAASALSPRQARLMAALAGGAVVLIAIVLAVAGVFSDGDEAGAGAEGSNPTDASVPGPSGDDQEFVRVPLRAQGGGDAQGSATMGLASADQPYLDLTLRGLEPAPQNQTYILWLLLNGERGFPMAPLQIPASGRFDDRMPIPGALLSLLPRVRQVDVSLADTQDAVAAVQRGFQSQDLVLRRPGDSILRGDIPAGQGAPEGNGSEGNGSEDNG